MPSVNERIDSGRDFINRRGDRLNQDAEDRARVARQSRVGYQQYADEAYDPLIGGRGGYNQSEQDMIFSDMRGNMTSPEEYDQNFLSPEEQNAMRGSPWDRAAYFDADSEMARQYESSGRQRGAVDQFGNDLTGAIGDDLGVDDGYMQDMRGMVTGAAGRMRGAVDPTRLRADTGALDRIRMSPEEQQRMVTAAGMSAGVGYRAAADDVTRRTRAAGMNPLGAAAVRERLDRRAAVDGADAMTLARVRAGESAASRAGQAEGIRMRGEESAADRVGQSERDAGNFEFGARSNMEGMRIGTAQDRSNRRMNAATAVGQSRIQTERDNAGRETQSRQFNTGMGTDIATGIERDSAARAGAVAGNRQATARGNQNQRFGQGMEVSNTNANRAIAVGNARRQDAAEGRGYLQNRINAGTAEERADYNLQMQGYGTQGGLLQGNTSLAVQQDQAPRWWERVIGAGTQVAGALLGAGGVRGN